jgi:hypothetical protein
MAKKSKPLPDDENKRAYVGMRTTMAMQRRIRTAATVKRWSVSQWMEVAAEQALDKTEMGDKE